MALAVAQKSVVKVGPIPGALVRELPLHFGEEGKLVGVVTTPSGSHQASSDLGVVVLNAGVLHRVGPHRLHVNLARRLAEAGVTCLRFDVSGVGDSRSVPGSTPFRQSAVCDARAAMNWLSDHRRLERFILFGLCSGADNALATAEADPRVVGLVLVDPPSYVTPQAKVRHALTRASTLTNPEALASWSGAALRRLGGIMDKLLEAPEEAADADEPEERVLGREVPSQAEYGELLHLLTDRGLSILSIYSAALRERFNHPDQLIELYPELKGKVQTLYFPEANHVFTELDAQAGLVSGVCDWVERSR